MYNTYQQSQSLSLSSHFDFAWIWRIFFQLRQVLLVDWRACPARE